MACVTPDPPPHPRAHVPLAKRERVALASGLIGRDSQRLSALMSWSAESDSRELEL